MKLLAFDIHEPGKEDCGDDICDGAPVGEQGYVEVGPVKGGLGGGGKRDAAGVALFPMQGLRLVGRGHGGAWFNDKPLSSLKRAPVWLDGQKFLSQPGQ